MHCPYCGKKNDVSNLFCRGCGKRLPDKYENPVGPMKNNRLKNYFYFLFAGVIFLAIFTMIGIYANSQKQKKLKAQIEKNAYSTNEIVTNSPETMSQQQALQSLENDEGKSAYKEWIALTRNNRTLFLVKPDGKEEKKIFESSTDSISFLKWSPNGRYLSFGTDGSSRYDGSLMIWEMEEEKLTSVIKNWEGDVKWNTKSDDYLLVMIILENNDPMIPPGQKLSLWNTNSQDMVTITEELGSGYQWVDAGTSILYDIDGESSEGEYYCPNLPSWVSKDGIYSYNVMTKETFEVVPEKKNPLGLQFASPDGKNISFVEFEPHCTGADDFCWPVDDVRSVDVNQPAIWNRIPYDSCMWSYDGKIIFCGDDPCNNPNPFVFLSANGEKKKTYENELKENFYADFDFANKIWSRDNTNIVVNSWQREKNERLFFVFSISNNDYLEGIIGEAVDWSPDSDQILVLQGEIGKSETIGIFDIVNGEFVTNLGPGTHAAWQHVIKTSE